MGEFDECLRRTYLAIELRRRGSQRIRAIVTIATMTGLFAISALLLRYVMIANGANFVH